MMALRDVLSSDTSNTRTWNISHESQHVAAGRGENNSDATSKHTAVERRHGHLHAAAQQVRCQQPGRAEPTEQSLRNRGHTLSMQQPVRLSSAGGQAVGVAAQAEVTCAAGSLSQRKCMQLRMAGSDASSASCSRFTSVLRRACWGSVRQRVARRTSRTRCSSCPQCQPSAPRRPRPPASAP